MFIFNLLFMSITTKKRASKLCTFSNAGFCEKRSKYRDSTYFLCFLTV